MNTSTALKIILKPHITEKTFAMIENDKKICFIVKNTSNKNEIAEAINSLYNEKCIKINVNRTLYGKKAFVKFETVEKARDLATKIGML
ncbi:MAG: 50S ribosomal protein L23 [Nitrosopumilaceae archaeon]|jgi:large subunit ribosomal protein L23|nr:50S ribosomal protein L23 [Nitrosopumilaceae archaeon]